MNDRRPKHRYFPLIYTRVCVRGLLHALLLMLFGVLSVQAAEWSSELKGGGVVSVDQDTNRATLSRHGVATQLSDGVHQLKDGSTIEVHSGIVVPTAAMIELRQPKRPLAESSKWIGVPFVGDSPCEKLVRRVCGDASLCASATGCVAARQLLVMEQEERDNNATPNTMTFSSGQCLEADVDKALFVTCGQMIKGGE